MKRKSSKRSEFRYSITIQDLKTKKTIIRNANILNIDQKTEVNPICTGKSEVTNTTTIEIVDTFLIDDPFAR